MRGYLLAGGLSRRLGTDKRYEAIGAETLISRAIRVLSDATESCFVVAREHPGESVPFVPDLRSSRGALTGVETALAHAGDAGFVILLACDYPLLESRTLRKLIAIAGQVSRGTELVVPRIGKRSHPLVSVWESALRSKVAERLDAADMRVMNVLASSRVQYVSSEDLGCDEVEFLNVNEPAQLERARRITRERQLQPH